MANPVTITPSLGHAPLWLQGIGTPGYDAVDLRRAGSVPELGEGVTSFASFRVKQRAAGANMSVDVEMDDIAYVRGDSVTLQGMYPVVPHSGTLNVDIAAAHATLPRLDVVVLEVKDNTHDAGGLNNARVRTVAGTPTSGATLDNRTGAPALPASAMHLADVLVAAADTAITDAEIRDRRPFLGSVIPPLLTDQTIVPALLYPGVPVQVTVDATADLAQSAILVRLPQRIVNANRIRWRYGHSPTVATGNYVIGIYDASGRKIVDTGSVAITGAANTIQIRQEIITPTTFDAGSYYVLFGIDITGGGASIRFSGFDSSSTGTLHPTAVPNVYFFVSNSGVNAPQTLLGATDYGTSTVSQGTAPVPAVALAVG